MLKDSSRRTPVPDFSFGLFILFVFPVCFFFCIPLENGEGKGRSQGGGRSPVEKPPQNGNISNKRNNNKSEAHQSLSPPSIRTFFQTIINYNNNNINNNNNK